jgi:hypothetical protein
VASTLVSLVAALTITAALGFDADQAQARVINCGTTARNCHALQVGVNEDWAANHYHVSDLNLANQGGLEWLRFPWSWADTQPGGPGEWNWAYTDRIMNAAQVAGERVIFKPQGSPCWAHPSVPCTSSSTVPPDPRYLPRWQHYIQAVLQRYPKTIAAVEVWNEPNLRPFWDAPISPARYTQVLRSAYTAVKSIDPKLRVVAGGLAAVTTTTPRQMDYRGFLRKTLSKGAKGYFDAVAIHPYPSYLSSTYLGAVSKTIDEIRNIVGPTMPIWLTEFGYPAPTVASEPKQATQIAATLDLLAHTKDVPVAIVHRMFDTGGTDIWAHYGLIGTDYTPKPSYGAVSAWTHPIAARWMAPPTSPASLPIRAPSSPWRATPSSAPWRDGASDLASSPGLTECTKTAHPRAALAALHAGALRSAVTRRGAECITGQGGPHVHAAGAERRGARDHGSRAA